MDFQRRALLLAALMLLSISGASQKALIDTENETHRNLIKLQLAVGTFEFKNDRIPKDAKELLDSLRYPIANAYTHKPIVAVQPQYWSAGDFSYLVNVKEGGLPAYLLVAYKPAPNTDNNANELLTCNQVLEGQLPDFEHIDWHYVASTFDSGLYCPPLYLNQLTAEEYWKYGIGIN